MEESNNFEDFERNMYDAINIIEELKDLSDEQKETILDMIIISFVHGAQSMYDEMVLKMNQSVN